MEKDNQYGTLSEAVDDLCAQGYIDELELGASGLFNGDDLLDPTRFTIDSFHRFEGLSDPGDMSIVYAISCHDLGIKGLLVSSYGAEGEEHIQRMVQSLDAHHAEGKTRPVQAAPPGTNVKV
ncbi:MAG: phosphoribosylpyrophosphate synthetase [Flavobacteriales bacterium]